jgi:hypothetical protein
MTVTKRFIPYNGTGTSTDGLLLILTSGGPSQGYVWEGTYPGGGAVLPPKTISRHVLGRNDVRVYLNEEGKLNCGDGALSADWVSYQNLSDVWINYYGNATVNISLDARTVQAATNRKPCLTPWQLRMNTSKFDLTGATKRAQVPLKKLVPFNGGPQKITCLMIYPERPFNYQKGFFWEQAIDSAAYGRSQDVDMLNFILAHESERETDYVKFTIFVGLGDAPETSLLYQARNLELDLGAGEGDTIYVNFYSSNMTANVSLDGKIVHASANLEPA